MKIFYVLFIYLSTVTYLQADTMWVAVKKSTIKQQASFLSATLRKVQYQDEIELNSKESVWLNVSFDGTTGWMHQSALSEEKGSLEEKEGPGAVSKAASFFGGSDMSMQSMSTNAIREQNAGEDNQDDITLAGKGFNKDIESVYRKENEKFNYQAVDEIESKEVDVDSLNAFANEGHLVSKVMPSETKSQSSSNDDYFGSDY